MFEMTADADADADSQVNMMGAQVVQGWTMNKKKLKIRTSGAREGALITV